MQIVLEMAEFRGALAVAIAALNADVARYAADTAVPALEVRW